MSMFKSIGNAIATTADTVAQVAETTGKSVNVATKWVDRRAHKLNITDKANVIADTTEEMIEIRHRLEADEEFATLYAELEKDFP